MDHIFTATGLLLLFEWLIRLGFILYIPRKRAPSSAIAWLLVVFLLPEFGILLFLFLGSTKLSRHRQKIQKYLNALIEKSVKRLPNSVEVSERYQSIVDLSQNLGKMPLSVGNSVRILPDYNKAIQDITLQIDEATEFIHLEYFILAYDATT